MYPLSILFCCIYTSKSWKDIYVSDMRDNIIKTLQNFDVTFDLVSSIWRVKVKESLALGKDFAGIVVPKNVQSFSHFASSSTSSINRFSDGIDSMINSFQAFENCLVFLRLEKAWLIDMVDHKGVKCRAWVWTFVTFFWKEYLWSKNLMSPTKHYIVFESHKNVSNETFKSDFQILWRTCTESYRITHQWIFVKKPPVNRML